MMPQEFVSCIQREVVEANLAIYRQNFEQSLPVTTGGSTRWPQIAALYQSLAEEQQPLFMEGIRQVIVDTVSNIFGILDGSTLLETHRDYFHLTYGDHPQELNGELQDLFLAPK